MPRPCVCGARSRFGGPGPVPGVVSPPFPPSRPACPALCVAGRPVRVSLNLARWYAIPRDVCVLRARSGCPSGCPACPFRVCALTLPRRPLPPPSLPWVVWRAHLARSRRWALVGPFHAVLAPTRVLPRSLAPSGVLGRERPFPVSPLPGFGARAPRGVGLRVRGVPAPEAGVGGGRAACAPRPPFVRPGGPVGPGVALPRSVPLHSLGRQQSGCHWRRSGHGGRGPHTAPVCARLPSLGAARVAPWRVGAGSSVPRGSCRSRRLVWRGGPCSRPPLGRRGPAGGRGDPPLCLGGVGAGTPGACGLGWVALRPPCSPSGGRPALPYPAPLLVVGPFPPGVRVGSGSRGRPVHRVRPAWRGGGEGRPVNRSPGGPVRPKPPLRPPRVGNIAGVTSDALVIGGAAPILLCLVAACRPQGRFVQSSGALVRARPSAATRAGAGGRGRWGARRAGQAASPPPRRGPFWGRGASPRLRGLVGCLVAAAMSRR